VEKWHHQSGGGGCGTDVGWLQHTAQQQQSQLTSAGQCPSMLHALAAQQGLEMSESKETSDNALELK